MKYSLIVVLVCSMHLRAAVGLVATPTQINANGACELLGSMTYRITGNDFLFAGPATPVYLRFKYHYPLGPAEAVPIPNCGDLVTPSPHVPIFLGVYLDSDSNATINVPPASVSIVRAKDGEFELWLKIAFSTGEAVNRGGVLGPPTEDTPVYITFGISAGASQALLVPLFNSGKANQMFNQIGNTPVPTELFANCYEAGLQEGSVVVSGLGFDWQTLNVETAIDPDDIVLGSYAIGGVDCCVVIGQVYVVAVPTLSAFLGVVLMVSLGAMGAYIQRRCDSPVS